MRRITHKFKAKPVNSEEGYFGSKLEHAYYQQLLLRQKAGDVLFFLRQVPIGLPGNKKYVCDFVEFLASGEVVFTECKGMKLPMGQLKIAQVEDLYPIKINVVTKV